VRNHCEIGPKCSTEEDEDERRLYVKNRSKRMNKVNQKDRLTEQWNGQSYSSSGGIWKKINELANENQERYRQSRVSKLNQNQKQDNKTVLSQSVVAGGRPRVAPRL